MVSVDVKHHVYLLMNTSELRRCVKVEVAVLGSPSLISLMVSVDGRHHVYLLTYYEYLVSRFGLAARR